jgi:hypothetical protein
MTPELSTTEQLLTVIARYRPDEDAAWHEGMRETLMAADLVKDRYRTLGILLEQRGLKNAYGEDFPKVSDTDSLFLPIRWQVVSRHILQRWQEEPEGDIIGAITAAYQFLQ